MVIIALVLNNVYGSYQKWPGKYSLKYIWLKHLQQIYAQKGQTINTISIDNY